MSDGGKKPIEEENSAEPAPGWVAPCDEFWERMQEGFAAQERERAEEAAFLCSQRPPARPDEILAARHAATMQYAMTHPAALANESLESSDLGAKLERAVHMALDEVVAILRFSLDPGDRAFAAVLKAKTTILTSVLNAQVRVDERRFVKEDTEHDIEMEKLFSERMKKAQLEIDRINAAGSRTVHVTYNRMNQSRMLKETE